MRAGKTKILDANITESIDVFEENSESLTKKLVFLRLDRYEPLKAKNAKLAKIYHRTEAKKDPLTMEVVYGVSVPVDEDGVYHVDVSAKHGVNRRTTFQDAEESLGEAKQIEKFKELRGQMFGGRAAINREVLAADLMPGSASAGAGDPCNAALGQAVPSASSCGTGNEQLLSNKKGGAPTQPPTKKARSGLFGDSTSEADDDGDDSDDDDAAQQSVLGSCCLEQPIETSGRGKTKAKAKTKPLAKAKVGAKVKCASKITGNIKQQVDGNFKLVHAGLQCAVLLCFESPFIAFS